MVLTNPAKILKLQMNPNFSENKLPKNRGWIMYILSLTLASPLQITLLVENAFATTVKTKWKVGLKELLYLRILAELNKKVCRNLLFAGPGQSSF